MTPVFDSANEIQHWALEEVMKSGRESAPRREVTRELLFVAFELTNPRHRCVTIPERRWSLPLAVGEFCWHAAASDKVDFISYYAKRWRDFSDDGLTIAGSCYGKKIFSAREGGESQWSAVTNLLRTDPESRRAILTLQSAEDRSLSGRDVACATSLQFLVRAGALHAVVNMRSNDAVWGLPYDLFVFTMFQELMAVTLGLDLGSYHHVAASLHVYERHFQLAEQVIRAGVTDSQPMPTMTDVSRLPSFLAYEERLRLGLDRVPSNDLDPYWANMVHVLAEHRDAKRAHGGRKSIG
jgi:thymidylate synthase